MRNAECSTSSPPSLPIDDQVFQINLLALRTRQPEFAQTIEEVGIGVRVEPAVGRDGSPTFRVIGEDGRRRWFGGSSMPSISARELFGNADGDAGNVSLPGIGTGREVTALLDRLPPYRALFVIEEDPGQLRLALHLHDYSDAIAAGRLELLPAEELADSLVAYFERNPGCELPTRMFSLPQRSASKTAELRRRLELAGERVMQTQARAVAALRASIADRRQGPVPENPCTTLLSIDPSPWTNETVQRAAGGLERLGWNAAICIPDRPDRCHLSARLAAIAEVRADWVLMVNSFAGPLRSVLPPEMPVVCWFDIGASVPDVLGAKSEPGDLLFTASRDQWERLKRSGVSESSIRYCGPALEAQGFEDGKRSIAVAVVMDVPDARATACGINLPSHIALWDALRQVAESALGERSSPPAGSLVVRAEKASGVELGEPGFRERFITLFEERMRPALSAVACVTSLRRARVAVEVWGAGWSTLPGGGINSNGPIPSGDQGRRVPASIETLVVPCAIPATVRTALQAIACGVRIVLLGDDGAFRETYPGLATFSERFRFVPQVNQLVEVVKSVRTSTGVPPGTEDSIESLLVRMRNEVRAARM